jgi:hypothetical protein
MSMAEQWTQCSLSQNTSRIGRTVAVESHSLEIGCVQKFSWMSLLLGSNTKAAEISLEAFDL